MLPPKIDCRSFKTLVKEMKEMVPFYTPEWRFNIEDPDVGSTLFLIFAKMFYGNIKRINNVTMKNFNAFVNLFDVNLLPAKPAHSILTFKLSEGCKEPVFISKGTQAYAESQEDGSPIIFETENSIMVTPAEIVKGYNVDTETDKIFEIPEECLSVSKENKNNQFNLFDFSQKDNLQEHCFYLGHDELFNIKETSIIKLQFSNSQRNFKEQYINKKLADKDYVEWSYGTENEWINFEEVYFEDNSIILKKNKVNTIENREIYINTSRWIRGKIKDKKIDKSIEIDGVKACIEFYDKENKGGIVPDMIFSNDMEKDKEGFYPFGEFFSAYSVIYLASSEVLSKKGAEISINFDLDFMENRMQQLNVYDDIQWKMIMKKSDIEKPKSPDISVAKVTYEYWNGESWLKLFSNKENEEIFSYPFGGKKSILFMCPLDMAKTSVNNQENYWIRIRIESIKNMYSLGSYQSPWIENIKFNYDVRGNQYPVKKCLTYNNREYVNQISNLKENKKVFRPFYSLDCKFPAFYIGVNKLPVKGPISIFFLIGTGGYSKETKNLIEWQYLSKQGNNIEWKTLKTIDETEGFTQNGTVVFIGPDDFSLEKIMGNELYWIRILKKEVNMEETFIPTVKGMYINSTPIIQQETVKSEIIKKENNVYMISKTPVISQEVWVDETKELTESQIKNLKESGTELDILRDSGGNIMKGWVKWKSVNDFLESSSRDRHYNIEQSTGIIKFGDGKNGMHPTSIGREGIKVNYKFGGGKKGNCNSFVISQLQESIAFIDEVFNPIPAGGGCEREKHEEALKRGAQIIRHRNRAVTAEDFEALAHEASQNIAKVKCLSNYNDKLEKETGCITIVIYPKGGSKELIFFDELKQEVEKYILERTMNTIVFSEKLKVIQPVYIEISVSATLVVGEVEEVIYTEKETVDKLNKFLDPFKGNYDGKGWAIGQYVYDTTLFPLLKSINTVNYIEKILMTIYKIENGVRSEIDINYLSNIPHGLIVNGKHNIFVRLINE